MSEEEFLIMDQLYFVTSFEDIKELSGLGKPAIIEILGRLINKDWVKCFDGPENEIVISDDDFKIKYAKYHYLATKRGLLEHNMR